MGVQTPQHFGVQWHSCNALRALYSKLVNIDGKEIIDFLPGGGWGYGGGGCHKHLSTCFIFRQL
jgi:hypothetical protein